MIFHYYSPSHFEPWDFRNPDDKGIGGSETAHVETCIRLAKRGHKVSSYSPLPKDIESGTEYKGVWWFDLKDADFKENGIWIMGRAVKQLDKFEKDHPDQKIWLVMQDVQYALLTHARAKKLDRLLPLCETHAIYTENILPECKDKIFKSSNGIKVDLINSLPEQKRDPHRMMYSSSPDRGLVTLLKIFPKIRERVKDATLHVFYGFDNISKYSLEESPIDSMGTTMGELKHLMNQEGITWHGRVGQKELYAEWLKTGVWAYTTRFSETSCITSMEAQALGAIPVTNPFWALKDNIMYGTLIDGDPGIDGLTQLRYIEEITFWLTHNNLISREQMMNEARKRFDWEKVVDQYEYFAKD